MNTDADFSSLKNPPPKKKSILISKKVEYFPEMPFKKIQP